MRAFLFPFCRWPSCRSFAVLLALGVMVSRLSADVDDAAEKANASAQAALKRQDYDEAILGFTESIRVNSNDFDAYSGRAEAYAAKKDFARAAADYTEVLRLQPNFAGPRTARAEAYAHLGKMDLAIADYTELIRRNPDRAEAYFSRGYLYAMEKKRPGAVQDFNDALRLIPHNTNTLLARAKNYQEMRGYSAALDDVNEASLTDGASPDVHLEFSSIYEECGDYALALEEAQQVLRLETEKTEGYNNLAWLLSVCPEAHFRDGKKALEYATKACEQSGWNSSVYLDTLAAAYAEIGQFEDAAKWEKKSIPGCPPEELEGSKKRIALYEAHHAFQETTPDPQYTAWDKLRYDTFETVWSTVDQEYFDPTMGGVDWPRLREKYRARLTEVADEDQLRPFLQEMLNELHKTHFAIVPRSTAVFSPEERVRQGTVGAQIEVLGGKILVAKLTADSPAAKGGLKLGDAISSVDGIAMDTIADSLAKSGVSPTHVGLYLKGSIEARFNGEVGSSIHLSVTGTDGKKREVTFKCVAFGGTWSEPVGNFPSEPMDIEATRSDDGIGYLRFNVFALPIMKPAKNFLRSLKPSDGLVIDLRDNPGGAIVIAPGLSGWLSEKELTMGTMHVRDSDLPLDVYPQEHAFLGPIAVLINGSSASTSEILAGGLRDAHRARLFGETTAGAALPSAYKRLPTGDLFQYAIGDVRTQSGQLLEGSGVEPDDRIAGRREDFAAGKDPVLSAAKAWLEKERNAPAPPSSPKEVQ